jgi:hypothetical protein
MLVWLTSRKLPCLLPHFKIRIQAGIPQFITLYHTLSRVYYTKSRVFTLLSHTITRFHTVIFIDFCYKTLT